MLLDALAAFLNFHVDILIDFISGQFNNNMPRFHGAENDLRIQKNMDR